MRRVRWVACVAALLLVAAACGGDDQAESGAPSTSSEPPTILFAGDSVMEELAAGLVAALDGVAEARYVGLSSVVGNGTAPTEWEQLFATEGPPDLVVVMVGWWESIGVTALAGGIDVYPATLAPLLQVLTAETDVLWLGYPALLDEPVVTMDQLATVWSALPASYPRVEFFDAGAAVEADGQFRNLLDVDGRQVLVRQVDGKHLCPDGVVLMAEAVLGQLHQRFGIEPEDGWQQGSWRDPGTFPDDGLCYDELGTPLSVAP